MKNYTNASWITVIDGIQVAESAKYRSGKDVIFMKSYDNILENSALDYKKSFFVYDVTKVSTIFYVFNCFVSLMLCISIFCEFSKKKLELTIF